MGNQYIAEPTKVRSKDSHRRFHWKLEYNNKIRRHEAIVGYLFLIPSLIGVSIFILIPFLDAVRRSFSKVMTREFVGFANYQLVFQNQAFQRATNNTVRFICICLPLLLVISLVLSVMLFSIKQFQAFLKTSFLLPMAIPAASIVLLWQVFFQNNGIFNKLLDGLGLPTYDWINSNYAFVVLVFTYIWKNVGYDMVLWLAGLNSIGQEMYESAAIDGAGKIRQFFYITIPNLLPTTFIVIVLSLINSFKVFREAYLIAGSYPHQSIYMLQHLFNNWFAALDVQKLCAAAVLVALVMVVTIGLLNLVLGKDRTE